MPHQLPLEFYTQDTIEVARSLLGQRLVRRLPTGERVSGLIVETEAYLGAHDPACHSFGYRRTPRTETMYLPGGHSYIYFVYGMHYCFNVVTYLEGEPEAVLIRALEPDENQEFMIQKRGHFQLTQLTNGPAKLCQALAIDKSLNATLLNGDTLSIETVHTLNPPRVSEGPRVGIDYAQDAIHWPLRFWLQDNPFVSQAKTAQS